MTGREGRKCLGSEWKGDIVDEVDKVDEVMCFFNLINLVNRFSHLDLAIY